MLKLPSPSALTSPIKLYFCVVPERGKLLFRKNRFAKMSAKMFAESVRFVLAECNISVNTSIQVIRMEIL